MPWYRAFQPGGLQIPLGLVSHPSAPWARIPRAVCLCLRQGPSICAISVAITLDQSAADFLLLSVIDRYPHLTKFTTILHRICFLLALSVCPLQLLCTQPPVVIDTAQSVEHPLIQFPTTKQLSLLQTIVLPWLSFETPASGSVFQLPCTWMKNQEQLIQKRNKKTSKSQCLFRSCPVISRQTSTNKP